MLLTANVNHGLCDMRNALKKSSEESFSGSFKDKNVSTLAFFIVT